MPWGTKNMPPKKNLSRGSLSNWCDADADADISKTICQPPPYGGGGDIMKEVEKIIRNGTNSQFTRHGATLTSHSYIQMKGKTVSRAKCQVPCIYK